MTRKRQRLTRVARPWTRPTLKQPRTRIYFPLPFFVVDDGYLAHMSGLEARVYLAVCHYAPRIFPSIERLANDVGVKVHDQDNRNVRRALAQLEAWGLIHRLGRPGGGSVHYERVMERPGPPPWSDRVEKTRSVSGSDRVEKTRSRPGRKDPVKKKEEKGSPKKETRRNASRPRRARNSPPTTRRSLPPGQRPVAPSAWEDQDCAAYLEAFNAYQGSLYTVTSPTGERTLRAYQRLSLSLTDEEILGVLPLWAARRQLDADEDRPPLRVARLPWWPLEHADELLADAEARDWVAGGFMEAEEIEAGEHA